jgi:spore coat protein CotH
MMALRHAIFWLLLIGFSWSAQAQKVPAGFSLYDPAKIQDIKIIFKESNWDYLLDSLRLVAGSFLPATLQLNGKEFKDVGVRFVGNRAFSIGEKRNNLYLKLNHIHKEQNFDGITQLRLSNSLRDPSMVREVLGLEIVRDYMVAPRANYARLSVNDSNFGIYANVEVADEVFLQHHFGYSYGTFFRGNPLIDAYPMPDCKKRPNATLEYESNAKCFENSYELLSISGWDELQELTKILNQEPDKIGSILHVDAALWMHALNNVMVNLASYSGAVSENYYLYRDDKKQFVPIMSNFNYTFGSFKNTGVGSDLDLKGLQQLDPLLHETAPGKPLVSQLLKNPEYKKIYLAHIRTIYTDWFANGKYLDKAKQYQALIEKDFTEDPYKFYMLDEFKSSLTKTIGKKSKIPGISELMSRRVSFLKKDKNIGVVPPVFQPPYVYRRDILTSALITKFDIQVKVSRFTRKVKIFYRFSENEEFAEAPMHDDGKHNDNSTADSVFGISVTPPYGRFAIEYYFAAENAAALSFDPPQYPLKRYKTTLDELNN